MSAKPWTADEWHDIVWHARNARRCREQARILSRDRRNNALAAAIARHSEHRLRELALQTEIRGVAQ